MADRKKTIIIAALFLLSLSLFALAVKLDVPLAPASDARQYYNIAHHWLDNQEILLINNGLRAPAYPAFLILGFRLNDSLDFIYLLQFLILAAIAALVFLIALDHLKMDFAFAVLAGLGVLAWPYFVFYATLLLSEMLFTLFLVAGLYAYLNYLDREKDLKAYLAIGSLLALSALTRPTTLLLPVWVLVLGALWNAASQRRLAFERFHLPIIAIFYILLIPWTAYASLRLGHFVPIASSGPAFLETAAGTKYEYVYNQDESYRPGQEVGAGKYLLSKAKNFYRFWEPGADGYQAAAITDRIPAAKPLIAAYSLVFILMVIAALATLARFPDIKVRYCWYFILYFWAFHTVSRPSPRFTLPIIPIAVLLAVLTLNALWRRWQQKTRPRIKGLAEK